MPLSIPQIQTTTHGTNFQVLVTNNICLEFWGHAQETCFWHYLKVKLVSNHHYTYSDRLYCIGFE